MLADPSHLRQLALAAKAASGEFYGLNWQSVMDSDEFGVAPRVHLGGTWGTKLKMGCYSPEQATSVQPLADFLAACDPNTILELLDNVE